MSKSSKSIVNSQDLNSLPQNSELSISTDQLDYPPGSTVNITLTGLANGASATFQVEDLVSDPGDDGDADVYKSFAATDGGRGDLDGIANGEIVTKWTVPRNGDANNATLSLTATTADGAMATTTFTDAAGKISKVYQHWADESGAWNNNILSANKSEYSEGEVIPHVFVFKASNQVPLVNGQSYTFTITYNHYQANTNAGGFAVITDFNTSRTPGSLPGASPGQDPVIDGTFTNGGGIQGNFYTVDADITNVSDVTFTGTGTKNGEVTVTFTYTGPTTTNGIAEIYYGLQIAAPGDVDDQGAGPTNGASAWTGGSLQTTVSVGGSGATSIQLSPAAIIVPDDPAIEIVKTAGAIQDLDGNGVDAGDEVTYTYTVTNTGNVTLGGVTVVDDNGTPGNTLDDIPITLGDTELSPGEVTNGTHTKTLSQADIDAGSFTNLGTATGTSPTGVTVTDDDPETVQLPPDAAIDIVKTAGAIQDLDGNGLDEGDEVTYTYTVTNTGNVTLSGVTVVDDNGTPGNTLDDIPITLGDTELSPDEVTDGTHTKTLSQADIDAGSFTNLGTATGTTPAGGTVTDDDPETVELPPDPAIEIVKTAGAIQDLDGNGLDEGDEVTYTYTVTNTGNVTLSGVTVVDDNGTPGNTLDDIPITLGDTELSPDEVTDGTHTKTLSQADIDAGSFTNLGTATGTTPAGGTVTDDDPETVDLQPDSAIEIVKTAGAIQDLDGNGLDEGDEVTYTYTVTNTGNVTLSGVTVVDDNGTPGNTLDDIPITLGDTELSPDEVTDGTHTKTLSQADIDAGSFTNLGTATGTTPAGGTGHR